MEKQREEQVEIEVKMEVRGMVEVKLEVEGRGKSRNRNTERKRTRYRKKKKAEEDTMNWRNYEDTKEKEIFKGGQEFRKESYDTKIKQKDSYLMCSSASFFPDGIKCPKTLSMSIFSWSFVVSFIILKKNCRSWSSTRRS